MKKVFLTLFVLIVSVVMFGCSSDTSGDGDNVIKVGFVDPLTGPGAVFGVPQRDAVEMAVEEINEGEGVVIDGEKYTFEIIEEDNEANPNEAINAVNKLRDRDGVEFILGGSSSPPTMAIAETFPHENAVFLVGYAAQKEITTQGNENTFRTRPPSEYLGGATGQFVYDNGDRKVAYVGQSDATYIGFFDVFKEVFLEAGGEVVAEEMFSLGDQDMRTQITTAINRDPDALIVPGYVEQAAFVYRQARELGFEGNIYGFTGGTEEQYLEIVPPEMMEGVYDVRPEEIPEENRKETNIAFFENFTEKYGDSSGSVGLYAYDQVYVLKNAIEEAQSTDPEVIMDTIRNMSVPEEVTLNYYEVDGKMFDPNGQAYTPNIALIWEGEKWEFAEQLPSDPEGFSQLMSEETKENLN